MLSTVSLLVSQNMVRKDGCYARDSCMQFFLGLCHAVPLSNALGQSAIESAKNDHAMVVQSMLDNKASS